MRVRVRARGGDTAGFFTTQIPVLTFHFSASSILPPSHSTKRAVVFSKTTRRFSKMSRRLQ